MALFEADGLALGHLEKGKEENGETGRGRAEFGEPGRGGNRPIGRGRQCHFSQLLRLIRIHATVIHDSCDCDACDGLRIFS